MRHWHRGSWQRAPKGTEVPAEHCCWTAFSGCVAGVSSKILSVSLEESNGQYLLLMKKCQLKKCDYRKQVSETKLDGAVVEVLRKLVSNKKFAGMMREKINMEVDTTALDQEISAQEKTLRQSYLNKDAILATSGAEEDSKSGYST